MHQCRYPELNYAKPTRLSGRLRGLDKYLMLGLPRFRDGSRYVGPLPRSCGHGRPSLIGKDPGGGGFATGPSAAWPPGMCKDVALMVLNDWLYKRAHAAPGGVGSSRRVEVKETDTLEVNDTTVGDSSDPIVLVDEGDGRARQAKRGTTQSAEGRRRRRGRRRQQRGAAAGHRGGRRSRRQRRQRREGAADEPPQEADGGKADGASERARADRDEPEGERERETGTTSFSTRHWNGARLRDHKGHSATVLPIDEGNGRG